MAEKRVSRPMIEPRIIIHGGAGNITRDNLPPRSYEAYQRSLLHVLAEAKHLLDAPDSTALDVAVHAVSLLEDDPLFNCGKGAVFTRAGTNELEASVMVSKGYKKRGVGCMLLRHGGEDDDRDQSAAQDQEQSNMLQVGYQSVAENDKRRDEP